MTLVTTGLIRSIRLIRGRNKPILWRTALNFVESRLHSAKLKPAWLCAHLHEISGRGFVVSYHYPRALPPVTQSSALQAPECWWRTGDEIALQAPEYWWRACDATTYPHRT